MTLDPTPGDAERIDRSIYYAGLDDWPAARSLGVRISHRLARHIPLDLRRMRNAAPMVSFTFDDAPESSLTVGARLLEDADARATFYIATSLIGRRHDLWRHLDTEGIRELHRRGHEAGLHCHLHHPVGSFTPEAFAADIKRSREMLQAIDATIAGENFAYPYGHATFARKAQAAGLVRSSRSLTPGVNQRWLEAQLLRSVELCDSRLTDAELDRALDETSASNGWLVFSSHDVGDRPSEFGVSMRLFSRALEGVLRRGLQIVRVTEALDAAIGARA